MFFFLAQRCDTSYNEEVQNPEISSTSMEQIPVAVVPPFPVPSFPFVFDPENTELVSYPYQEYSAIVPVMDQRVYMEADSNNYQYFMLPTVYF